MIIARGNLAAVSLVLSRWLSDPSRLHKQGRRQEGMDAEPETEGEEGATQLKVPPLIMPSESEGVGKGREGD